MDFKEIVYKRRTIRRFKQEPVSQDILKELIDFARLAPVGMNIQSLEYIIITSESMRNKLFPLVNWALGLPKEQRTPEEGRKPTAYIIVLHNIEVKRAMAEFDVGAAVENILLGAIYHGLGCCWMGAINRDAIRDIFEIPEKYEIKQVISIGYPDEESKIEPYEGDFNYWKDDAGIMHVPKKSVDQSIFKIF